ncbi:MAG TPA: c-type cytochrome [Candidatus Acidoferrales bacterium]|jgi:mono/diheme cytochrome c family protein|nr:c-type cytochrome [Candidatus Acidoferrales bacterium]
MKRHAMKRTFLLLLAATAAYAQAQAEPQGKAQTENGAVERGAQLYRAQCAVPYCHGPDGTAGRAPRLTGHTYSLNGMFKVISWGIPGTGMPEFTSRLKTREIDDLVAFLMTLRGGAAAPAPTPVSPPRALTGEAKAGRALFFDAARTGACGVCHELDGWGVPVGPDLAALPPARFADLHAVTTHRVVTARPLALTIGAGEAPFPALLVERTDARVRVYDLTAALPVLRTFAAAQIALEPGTSWRHEQAARIYTSGELETITAYLRWRGGQ